MLFCAHLGGSTTLTASEARALRGNIAADEVWLNVPYRARRRAQGVGAFYDGASRRWAAKDDNVACREWRFEGVAKVESVQELAGARVCPFCDSFRCWCNRSRDLAPTVVAASAAGANRLERRRAHFASLEAPSMAASRTASACAWSAVPGAPLGIPLLSEAVRHCPATNHSRGSRRGGGPSDRRTESWLPGGGGGPSLAWPHSDPPDIALELVKLCSPQHIEI